MAKKFKVTSDDGASNLEVDMVDFSPEDRAAAQSAIKQWRLEADSARGREQFRGRAKEISSSVALAPRPGNDVGALAEAAGLAPPEQSEKLNLPTRGSFGVPGFDAPAVAPEPRIFRDLPDYFPGGGTAIFSEPTKRLPADPSGMPDPADSDTVEPALDKAYADQKWAQFQAMAGNEGLDAIRPSLAPEPEVNSAEWYGKNLNDAASGIGALLHGLVDAVPLGEVPAAIAMPGSYDRNIQRFRDAEAESTMMHPLGTGLGMINPFAVENVVAGGMNRAAKYLLPEGRFISDMIRGAVAGGTGASAGVASRDLSRSAVDASVDPNVIFGERDFERAMNHGLSAFPFGAAAGAGFSVAGSGMGAGNKSYRTNDPLGQQIERVGSRGMENRLPGFNRLPKEFDEYEAIAAAGRKSGDLTQPQSMEDVINNRVAPELTRGAAEDAAAIHAEQGGWNTEMLANLEGHTVPATAIQEAARREVASLGGVGAPVPPLLRSLASDGTPYSAGRLQKLAEVLKASAETDNVASSSFGNVLSAAMKSRDEFAMSSPGDFSGWKGNQSDELQQLSTDLTYTGLPSPDKMPKPRTLDMSDLPNRNPELPPFQRLEANEQRSVRDAAARHGTGSLEESKAHIRFALKAAESNPNSTVMRDLRNTDTLRIYRTLANQIGGKPRAAVGSGGYAGVQVPGAWNLFQARVADPLMRAMAATPPTLADLPVSVSNTLLALRKSPGASTIGLQGGVGAARTGSLYFTDEDLENLGEMVSQAKETAGAAVDKVTPQFMRGPQIETEQQ